MKVWIQCSDFSSSDLSGGSIDSATRVLSEFDWESELQKEKDAQESGVDCCSPWMGFVADNSSILHVQPRSDTESPYHYHYTSERTIRILWIFPYTYKSFMETVLARNEVPDKFRTTLIQYHYDGKHQEIVDLLQSQGIEWG